MSQTNQTQQNNQTQKVNWSELLQNIMDTIKNVNNSLAQLESVVQTQGFMAVDTQLDAQIYELASLKNKLDLAIYLASQNNPQQETINVYDIAGLTMGVIIGFVIGRKL